MGQAEGWPQPLKVYVSACRAPQLHGPDQDVDREMPCLHDLDSGEFWHHFERRYGENPDLQNDTVKDFVFPGITNDFRLLETYTPSSLEPLDMPITAFGASGDTRYTREQITQWQQGTKGVFEERWFEGKYDWDYWGTSHRYIVDNPGALLEFLSADLPLVGKGPVPDSAG